MEAFTKISKLLVRTSPNTQANFKFRFLLYDYFKQPSTSATTALQHNHTVTTYLASKTVPFKTTTDLLIVPDDAMLSGIGS